MSYIDCYDCEKDRCTCNCMKCHYHWLATRYKSNGQNNVRVAIKLVLGNSCRRREIKNRKRGMKPRK